jgi:glycosyltransferase involved in cell wall biosynthesis
MAEISVIICTHNPRPDYLRRVLDALRAQGLPLGKWELLLVDNASQQLLASLWDLSWHPSARHIREDELGLVPARLRGISESSGEIIVFVDDDNVLQPDYLQQALKISHEWPILGAWGGNIAGDFEEEPDSELLALMPLLAVRNIKKAQWSNQSATSNHAIPIGAGMCIRRVVAMAYSKTLKENIFRKSFDRQGCNLASSGDVDLALTACDIGYGTGLFPSLNVFHLIPTRRLQRDYLLNLEEEVMFGHLLLDSTRGMPVKQIATTERFLAWYAMFRHRGLKRAIIRAHWRARVRYVNAAAKLCKNVSCNVG